MSELYRLAATTTLNQFRIPLIGVGRACGSFGFMGLLGLLPIFTMTRFRVFPKEKYDERDYAFLQKSLLVGFCNGFALMVAVSSLIHHIFFVWLGRDTVPLNLLMLPTVFGTVFGLLAFSVMTLRLYYKGDTPNWEDVCGNMEGEQ
jgi:hypothetical protein